MGIGVMGFIQATRLFSVPVQRCAADSRWTARPNSSALRNIALGLGGFLFAAIVSIGATMSAQAQEIDIDLALADRSLGDEAAPVTILAYESFSCGHCAAFHRETYDALVERYVDTGIVRFVFRDYPLNLQAQLASQIARCASPARFFGIAKLIFETQDTWLNAANPIPDLGRIGHLAGLTTVRMETCVNSRELAAGIQASKSNAETEYGVSTTPSFVINGTLYQGRQTLDQFDAIIDPLVGSENESAN
jgi:protein-disulfide isomerase